MVESLAGSHSFKLSSIAAVACIAGGRRLSTRCLVAHELQCYGHGCRVEAEGMCGIGAVMAHLLGLVLPYHHGPGQAHRWLSVDDTATTTCCCFLVVPCKSVQFYGLRVWFTRTLAEQNQHRTLRKLCSSTRKAHAHFSAFVGFSTRACAGISGFRNRRGSAGASGACGSYSGSPASQYQQVMSYSPAATASSTMPI